MRKKVTDQAIIKGYVRLDQKIDTTIKLLRDMVKARVNESLPLNERNIIEQLPPYLIHTFLAAKKLCPCTINTITSHTGRCRTTEFQRLNQLVLLGLLTKRRCVSGMARKVVYELK